jgi:protein-S-isoprenylcysteine O-methyltransferase Ste14
MWALSKYIFSSFTLHFEGQRITAMIPFIVCVILLLLAIGFFKKQGTTVDPFHPDNATSLVKTGIYSVSRNPMYLAMSILLLGFVIKVGNPFNVLVLVFFVWYMTKYQIQPEEETLSEIFKEEYHEYCRKVRRWV